MEWVLIFFFIIFLVLNFKLKKPYNRIYDSGSLCFSGFFEPEFYDYLQQIEKEGRIRGDYDLLSKRGFNRDHLDMPIYWQKALRSRRENIVRVLSDCFLGIYILIIISLIKHDSIIVNITVLKSLSEYISIMSHFSIVPVLFWLWRRSHYDGLTQGYLNGYMDAFEKAEMSKDDSSKKLI